MADREYDIVLFGVTGFTGKLACLDLEGVLIPEVCDQPAASQEPLQKWNCAQC